MAEVPTEKIQQLRAQGYTNTQIIDVLQRDGFTSAQIFDAMNQSTVPDASGQSTQNDLAEIPQDVSAPNPGNLPPPPGAPNAPQQANSPDLPPPPGAMNTPPQANQMPPPAPQAPGADHASQTTSSPTTLSSPPRRTHHEIPTKQSSHREATASGSVSTEEYVEAIIDEKWAELEDDIQKVVEWKNRSEQRIQGLAQQVADLKDRFDKLHQALIGKIESYDKNILEVGAEIKAMEKVFSKVLPVFTDNVKQLNDITERMSKK